MREPKKRIHYFFPLEDVFDSVYRTTSLIGKHRKTKEGISRLDDIALTQDEYDTFLDLANDAGLEVFTKINAFINNEQPSYIFNDGVNNTPIFDLRIMGKLSPLIVLPLRTMHLKRISRLILP